MVTNLNDPTAIAVMRTRVRGVCLYANESFTGFGVGDVEMS
ncbi:hypothetical protein CKA32_000053 [Geitlerinema sp. FC II]|nr:hypothetical protein CKA32_000053 [Geitlerinema sp. FC II]